MSGLPEKSSQDGRLVVHLEVGKCVQIGEAVVKCFGVKGDKVQLLIQAPRHMEIVRETAKNKTKKQRETWQRIDDARGAEKTLDQQRGSVRPNVGK